MSNLFVIVEVKQFGEVGRIFTLKALVLLLTLSSSEVFCESSLNSKLITTELALEALSPQTIFARLVINKVLPCFEGFVTWWVT